MRIIKSEIITETIKELCIKGACHLPTDVYNRLLEAISTEDSPVSKHTLEILKENADIAANNQEPICQDTGMACIFVEIGQEVYVEGNLTEAINEGVRQGYTEGYLRKSVVDDPVFDRINTKDNTPAIIHYDIVPGDQLKITVAPKGFGSENMCQVKMLKPSDGIEGVKDFILKVVEDAGPNPCPPIVIGVGIGGKNSTIKISDGKINVTGNGYSGAGIGGADANITIIGGEINAAGKDGAAAIGAPANKNAGTIEIGGDAKITARGGDATDKIGAGAAIGNGGSSNNTSGAEADISVGDKSTAVIIRENGTPEAGHSHVFEGTPEVVEPTCTAAGQKVYTCSCGATETVILPALGHAFGEWVPDGAGHKTRTCTRCNEKEKAVDENYVAPKPGEEPAEKPDEKPSDTDTTPSEGSTPETDSTAEETVSYAPLCVVGALAYEQTVKDGRVLIAVPAQSASLTGSLHALKELKAKGAEVLVFRTQLCESTVSIDTLLAQGAETTTFILTHTKEAASLTVGGADHTDLLNK